MTLLEGRGRAAKKSNASDSAERRTPSAAHDSKAKDVDSSRVEGDVESSDVNEYAGDDMATSPPPQPVPPPTAAAKSAGRSSMRSAVSSVAGKRAPAGGAGSANAGAGAKAAATDDDASDVRLFDSLSSSSFLIDCFQMERI